MKPKLYIHVGRATHFLQWETSEFAKYFELVHRPDVHTTMLVFGPDVLEEAANIPASKRFAVLFPGFGRNPVYNDALRVKQISLIKEKYEGIFINNGPLELAYKGLKNIKIYPFSIDTDFIEFKRYRESLDSLLHVSNDGPQKDWQRSERIMQATGLKYQVYPPRNSEFYDRHVRMNLLKNKARKVVGLSEKAYLPRGYVDHRLVIKKYQQYDGFIHVARDIKDPVHLDGKYTASLIEAGLTGAILFWHDTFSLGNNLETVFDLPLDEVKAAEKIIDIKNSIDIKRHSQLTREEMLETFNVARSVGVRARYILEKID